MTDQSVPSVFTRGYTHRSELTCWSCGGEGEVEGYKCGICMGKGTYSVGCGSVAERDEHYGACYCFGCGRVVPSEEVVKE